MTILDTFILGFYQGFGMFVGIVVAIMFLGVVLWVFLQAITIVKTYYEDKGK